MLKLTAREIIAKIEKEEVFEAVMVDYSFRIKIDSYVPYVCAAVHDGHNFRKELWENCKHTEYERWYEEDPETHTMIAGLPITIAGMDSRFEYDLNRAPDEAVYNTAWGKELWRKPLSESEKELSLQKHHRFYRVMLTLMVKLEELFGAVLVIDMHSYNWRRWDREVPTFNIGTANIDSHRFKDAIDRWAEALQKIELPNDIVTSVGINDTFQGNGYFLKYITSNTKNTLVLATEISKIYCNEEDGTIYPEVVHAVADHLKYYIQAQSHRFYDQYSENIYD